MAAAAGCTAPRPSIESASVSDCNRAPPWNNARTGYRRRNALGGLVVSIEVDVNAVLQVLDVDVGAGAYERLDELPQATRSVTSVTTGAALELVGLDGLGIVMQSSEHARERSNAHFDLVDGAHGGPVGLRWIGFDRGFRRRARARRCERCSRRGPDWICPVESSHRLPGPPAARQGVEQRVDCQRCAVPCVVSSEGARGLRALGVLARCGAALRRCRGAAGCWRAHLGDRCLDGEGRGSRRWHDRPVRVEGSAEFLR